MIFKSWQLGIKFSELFSFYISKSNLAQIDMKTDEASFFRHEGGNQGDYTPSVYQMIYINVKIITVTLLL